MPCAAAHEQAAQAEKKEARLAADQVPEEACGFIAMDIGEGLASGGIQQIDKPGIIALLEMMHAAANQAVRFQFAAKASQFLTRP
ncbi:MAG TPA: hypothetical protein VFA13_05830, partial [Candidatus Acidoferrum sp.]|nr:hypothetical protein [Candidatus Acidoferrum sp.]